MPWALSLVQPSIFGPNGTEPFSQLADKAFCLPHAHPVTLESQHMVIPSRFAPQLQHDLRLPLQLRLTRDFTGFLGSPAASLTHHQLTACHLPDIPIVPCLQLNCDYDHISIHHQIHHSLPRVPLPAIRHSAAAERSVHLLKRPTFKGQAFH